MIRTLPAPPLDDRMSQLRRRVTTNKDRPSDYYEVHNWSCEARPYLSHQIVRECQGRGNPHKLELHHIAGRGKHGEEPGNWISLSQPVHSWVTDHSKPGFVLCAYVKAAKNEHDWWTWTALKTTYRLTALESDVWIAACEPWPVIERMRLELLEGA